MGGYGAYGKMPSLGDFFRITLPRSFCEPWDKWLQMVMSTSRAALGACWEAAYMSAPIWRFSLAGGLVGPQSVMGVMMPSVDRVGRAFPLTLARLGNARGPAEVTDEFPALEEIALDALDDGMTKERLTQSLQSLGDVPGASTRAPTGGGQWSALIGQELETFSTPGLPKGKEAIRLFDQRQSGAPA